MWPFEAGIDAVLFYMGLYVLAGILVSIFPHKKEMKLRQNEVKSIAFDFCERQSLKIAGSRF